jgi:hypothetical protein
MQDPPSSDGDLENSLRRVSGLQSGDFAVSDEAISDLLNKDPNALSDSSAQPEALAEDDYVPSESTITGLPR